MANYEKGSNKLVIHPDAGAGLWNSVFATKEVLQKRKWLLRYIIPIASSLVGADAATHLERYFSNRGGEWQINLERFIKEVPSAKTLYQSELNMAKAFVEKLPLGRWSITSTTPSSGYTNDNRNWFYAIGEYNAWGRGTALISLHAGKRHYQLEFEYCFFDCYNWDHQKKTRVLYRWVTDNEMGEFHLMGLAREYVVTGSIRKKVNW